MAMRVETLVQRYLDRWSYLLGLGKWRITWEVVDRPIRPDAPVAVNDHVKKRSGYRTAHIRFDRAQIATPAQVERTVIHELLHLFQHGIGEDAEKLIERLERPLRLTRQRLTRRP